MNSIKLVNINEKSSETVFLMLKEAALWLKEKGIDYWQNWLDPPDNHVNWIMDGVRNNQFYFVYGNEELVGMFRLQYEDEMFWGKKNDRAGYIHSFTIKRNLSGEGLGYRVLDEITKLLIKKQYNFLRLDCGKNIKNLYNYYKKYGFIEVGNVTVEGYETVLLQKKLL